VGGIALIVPLCSALIIWLWIGNMTILESPSSKLAIVAVLTVIITAMMIAVDAVQLRMGAEDDVTARGVIRSGPVSWCVIVLLLWIICFPAYYFRRARYGQRNYVVVAIIVALIFLGMVAGFSWAIEKNKSDIMSKITTTDTTQQEATTSGSGKVSVTTSQSVYSRSPDESGRTIWACQVTVTNKSGNVINPIESCFSAVSSTGAAGELASVQTIYPSYPDLRGQLIPGGFMMGWIAFAIPSGESGGTFKFSEPASGSTQEWQVYKP